MAKDRLGTKIYAGNQVALQIGDRMVTGIVTAIDEGGLALVKTGKGEPQMLPGRIMVQVSIQYLFNPQVEGGIAELIVTLRQPETGNAAHEAPHGAEKSEQPL
jgi:hypothetical protein